MSYAKRVDLNQREIVDELREVGATVELMSRFGKVPDLLVGYRGVNYILEVKREKGQLSPEQVIWHATWRGQRAVVRNAEEALKCIGAIQ